MPQISIIIPVYNAESTLKRCIDSILTQSFSDFELILVDDGSNDTSPKLCDQYAQQDNRVIVIHKANGGVSEARNVGLNTAKGVWISFIDSDDEIRVDYFEQTNIYNQCDLIVCGFENIDIFKGCKSEIQLDNNIYKADELPSFFNIHINDKVLTAPWCKFFRLKIIKEKNIRFRSNITYGEDTVFVAEYMQHVKSLVYSPCIGYRYYCPDSKPVALRYKVTPQCAVEYATLYWEMFHKLAPNPIREDVTCFGRFFAMEIYCLKNKSYRKDRKLWFENDMISKIKEKTKLSVCQRIWYLSARNMPYFLYAWLLNTWLLISDFKNKNI